MSGGWRDGDERYEWLTGRRVLVEAVLAAAAESTPGVEIRRGTAVAGLVSGASALAGVPHVTGVRTKAGESITADLVVDMSGRRSALPGWLQDIGGRRPAEELEDSRFRVLPAAFPVGGRVGAAPDRASPDSLGHHFLDHPARG